MSNIDPNSTDDIKGQLEQTKQENAEVIPPNQNPPKHTTNFDISVLENDINRNNAESRLRANILLNGVYCAILNWLCSFIIHSKEGEKELFEIRKYCFSAIIFIFFLLLVFSKIEFKNLYPHDVPFIWICIQEVVNAILESLIYFAGIMSFFPVVNAIKNRFSSKKINHSLKNPYS